MEPKWLEWARELQALSQTGLTYTQNPFEIERFTKIHDIAAQMVAAYSEADIEHVRDLFKLESGHATPKVDVRGVVFQGDAILLVKEVVDGRWTLPGGWADVNETPSESAVREVWEESGYVVRAVKLLALYDRRSPRHGHKPSMFHIFKAFFLCDLLGGEATTSIETEDVGFFKEDAIPELSLGRVTPGQIARFYEHYRNPDLPTDFD